MTPSYPRMLRIGVRQTRSRVAALAAVASLAIAMPHGVAAQTGTAQTGTAQTGPTRTAPTRTGTARTGTGQPKAVRAGSASSKATTRPRTTLASGVAPGSGVRGAAWGLPDADALVQRVYARIIAQDKPGAVPIGNYQRRFYGREATLDAIRRFSGRDPGLAPSAFSPVDGWTDSPKLQIPLCEGPGCPAPINSIWLAITRIERGELPHELHIWYTTSFAAETPSGPTQQAYAFCERWLRVGGSWKYDGFVRVNSVPMGTQ